MAEVVKQQLPIKQVHIFWKLLHGTSDPPPVGNFFTTQTSHHHFSPPKKENILTPRGNTNSDARKEGNETNGFASRIDKVQIFWKPVCLVMEHPSYESTERIAVACTLTVP